MDQVEIGFFSALAEETSKVDESVGRFINGAKRNPATIFSHVSGCSAQPGFRCNCSFARMTLNEMCALDDAAHAGMEGLAAAPTIQFKLSERENKVLSNVSSFFGIVTAAKAAAAKPQPKLGPVPRSTFSGLFLEKPILIFVVGQRGSCVLKELKKL